MDRDSVDWRGYWPASPTPFTADGALDEQAMHSLIEHYVDSGVHGVLVGGSSGEWWAQSDDERVRAARIAVEAAAGRIPVVMGCTSFTSRQVAGLAAQAAEVGASGVLSTPPPYAHPTQEEILQFYREIDAATELPIIAYNWPRGTALEIEVDTLQRIADLDHVVAIKNSTSDWMRVVDTIEALSDRVRIFASLINRRGIAILREMGGDGYIDGGGIGAPFAVPFFDALWDGRLDEAREYADRWWSLTAAFTTPDFGGRFASPSAQLKAAMAMLGQPGGEVRAPLLPVTDSATLDAIAGELRSRGLLTD
ncbi:dihydrodipicolinate synthase family protein [Leucobacter sp. GX24907]